MLTTAKCMHDNTIVEMGLCALAIDVKTKPSPKCIHDCVGVSDQYVLAVGILNK